MPESVGSIPDDIRYPKDFPHYDTSLHDNPSFRQNLTAWASKTEKLSSILDALSVGFSEFHSAGVQQHKAATSVMSGLQKMSQILQNSSPSITEPLNKFVDSLETMWQYYEMFLGQTELLMVDPIKKMAKQFNILKGIYEELQKYRKEFITAADQMCACRHISKLNDSQHFQHLAETCYNAQKTYQLVLSKYLTCLREAHTTDMMDSLRRLLEHFLSIYSYHNSCAIQMKDLEVYMNQLFLKTKEWKLFYAEELEVWNELQKHIKKVVMLDYQDHMDNLPTNTVSKSTSVLKPMKRKMLLHQTSYPTTTFARTGSDQSPLPLLGPLPDSKISPVHPRKLLDVSPLTSPKTTPLRSFSIPVFPEQNILSSKKSAFAEHLKLLRSNSDADLLTHESEEEEFINEEENSSTEEKGKLRKRSQSTDDLTLSCDKEASLETASRKIEEILEDKKGLKGGGRLSTLLTNLKRKESKEKKLKGRPRAPSLDSESRQSGNSTPENSPFAQKKKRGFFQKARNSMYLFQGDVNEEDDDALSGRTSVERVSVSSNDNITPSATASSNTNGLASLPSSPNVIQSSSQPTKDVEVKNLINPVPVTWIKSGYLMLRMKLPNNTYAWTYIYCVVDREQRQLMVQEQSLPEPRPLEDLMLCTTKVGTPDFIDRNFCFRVISPTSEHLFQTLEEKDMQLWMSAIQEGIEEAIKHGNTGTRPTRDKKEDEGELVPNAIKQILKIPGNKQCADCNSTDVQWASINLGIVLCIECSGVHRGLGVHVSKVRSLTLDKWTKSTVQFMQSQGNTKSNTYYESRLGKGSHYDIHKPSASAGKTERMQFIQLKYVTLAFAPELTAS